MVCRYKIFYILTFAILALSMASCSDSSAQYEKQIEQLKHERDSISLAAAEVNGEYGELQNYVTGIGRAIDSIAAEERIISIGRAEGDRLITRAEMRQRLIDFGNLIKRQRTYIESLEDTLKNHGGSSAHLLTIISTLRSQLDSKDREISKLRTELSSSRKSVEELKQSFESISKSNERLEKQNETLGEAMKAQNEAINTGYVLIDTGKKLKELGVLAGQGLLRKKKLDYSNFNDEVFEAVDIRTFTGTTITGKKAKILTPAPEASYRMEKIGKNEWKFEILNPADFWSVSNYLVVQTD